MSFSTCLCTNAHQKAESISPSLESELALWFSVANSVQFGSVVQLCLTPCDPMNHSTPGLPVHHQLPESTMSIESVMPSTISSSVIPFSSCPQSSQIRVFSNESALRIKWPKYWSFSFNISPPTNAQDWSPLGCTGWISLQSKGLSTVFSNTTVQKHQFLGAQFSLYSTSHTHTWLLEKP